MPPSSFFLTQYRIGIELTQNYLSIPNSSVGRTWVLTNVVFLFHQTYTYATVNYFPSRRLPKTLMERMNVELEVWATSTLIVGHKLLVKILDYACKYFLTLAE